MAGRNAVSFRPTVTFLDANVLIAAATGQGDIARRAFAILDDPNRAFMTSPLVRLEVLPKAIYHRRRAAAEFYEAFFSAARSIDNMNAAVGGALEQATKHDIAPRDATMSEVLRNPCLLQDLIGGVTRLDLAIDGEAPLGDGAMPDLVVAFPLAVERATMIAEHFLHGRREVCHGEGPSRP